MWLYYAVTDLFLCFGMVAVKSCKNIPISLPVQFSVFLHVTTLQLVVTFLANLVSVELQTDLLKPSSCSLNRTEIIDTT